MNEAMITVTGNVATTPVFRELPSGALTRFRLAVTARRYDREKGVWTDGHTNFFTVAAWRGLADNVAASVSVGEPVIVRGRLKVRDEERGGQHWTSVDIEAVSVGHDMARGTSAFRRARKTESTLAPAGGVDADAAASAATGSPPDEAPSEPPSQPPGGPRNGPRRRRGRAETQESPDPVDELFLTGTRE
ncbi:single-stranded DNA-binding protein [Streptomyces tsukubensis]|uniref:single-stranded DNA-binding protein n=1 Tax=Streptomyces tsukubensis TaxID=83656 RepID=UPI00098ED36C|nr:single-stranded DNA-binding protein [Streptomyces tsukubensis]QFR93619.1 single-stranded DNA-binding protein [Streptomyces tsukubensis]